MLEPLHFVVEEFEDDRTPIDGGVGDGEGFLVAVKQRPATDRRGAARGQDVAEDNPTTKSSAGVRAPQAKQTASTGDSRK